MKTIIVSQHRAGRWFGAGLRAAVSGAALLTFTTPGSGVERQVLRGHVPAAVARLGLRPLGRLPATNRLNLAIGLPLRNTNALNKLLEDMYDPASPQFRRYLTPEQFTDQFGPTKEDYEAVVRFAKSHGLDITVTHSNRVLLDVAGQVAHIEKAFQITLHTYKHPTEARQFYAPEVEPFVEAGLAVLDISGLNNYSIPRPASHKASAKTASGPGSGSGPNGSYMGKDFRNAYAPAVTLTGAGQMVGLLAFTAFYAGDIATYETMAGLPNVPIQVVLLDGYNGIPVPGNLGTVEADLDIEMAISMAPGLSKVVVFDAGPNGVLNDVLNAMAANPQIKQFSSSWIGWSASATTDNIFKQMAAQGQSFFQASGDGDSWANNLLLRTVTSPDYWIWPADDPYVTSVGGTSLTMNSSGASYASERVWNDGNTPPGWDGSGYLGSGGGISATYAIPSWQKGLDMSNNRGSMTKRNFPDVAMVAENFLVAANGSTGTGYWGTSFAAPLWAGFMALVNQEAAANGEPPVGFLNPALYALGQSADYTNNFHDITLGNNATPTSGSLFPAVPGYDLCTGSGLAQGQQPDPFAGPASALSDHAQLSPSLHRSRWRAAQSERTEPLTHEPNRLARLEPGPGCRLADRLAQEWNARGGRPGYGCRGHAEPAGHQSGRGQLHGHFVFHQPQRSVCSNASHHRGDRHPPAHHLPAYESSRAGGDDGYLQRGNRHQWVAVLSVAV